MRRHRQRVARDGRSAADVASQDVEKAAQEELRAAIKPVVREALTEDVLQGINALVQALPLAIGTAIANLESDDEAIRQQAATLIMRHSAGNKAIVPDVNQGKGNDLTIVFDLPRPASSAELGGGEDEVVETKECDSCHTVKPLGDFVGRSDRCIECFERMKNSVVGLAETADQPA